MMTGRVIQEIAVTWSAVAIADPAAVGSLEPSFRSNEIATLHGKRITSRKA